MRPYAIDLTDRVFGRWTVLGPGRRPGGLGSQGYYNKAWWQCRCLCGTERPVVGEALRQHRSRSCGCLRAESNRRTMQSRRAAAGAALQAGSAGVVAPVRLILETVGSPRTEAVILLVDPLQGHHDMAWRLTPQEHAALALLLSHEGRLVTRHTLMVRLPCRTSDQVRQPDGVIFRLRRKLTAVGWSGAIKGVWGEGYRLVQPPQ